jgi:hypothetical protein
MGGIGAVANHNPLIGIEAGKLVDFGHHPVTITGVNSAVILLLGVINAIAHARDIPAVTAFLVQNIGQLLGRHQHPIEPPISVSGFSLIKDPGFRHINHPFDN